MSDNMINKLRELQMIMTVIIFVLVTIVCWDTYKYLHITKIELSIWGVKNQTRTLWNATLGIVSVGILFNTLWWIYKHKRLKYKQPLYILFTAMSVCLFMVAIFPTMRYSLMHDVPALVYFFFYPLSIFTLAFLNRTYITYNEWLKHTLLAVMMIVLPLILLGMFSGGAIAEIAHTTLVAIWNLSLMKRNKLHLK